MRYFLLISVYIFLFSTIIYNQTAIAPSLGDGTLNNPYRIANLENLYWIAATNSEVINPDQNTRWNSHYIQTVDIDALETLNWNSGEGWVPIGNSSNYFYGTYNGNGYEIQNLYINKSSNFIGLFGVITNALIENVKLVDINLTGLVYVGGISGATMYEDNLLNNMSIINCTVSGIINGSDYVGGITGWNYVSEIQNCGNSSNITGQNNVGGIVGGNEHSFAYTNESRVTRIRQCYNKGEINGNFRVGGIVGSNLSGWILDCYNRGAISGDEEIGGLIGYHFLASSTPYFTVNISTGIYNSYNTGGITANSVKGALIGRVNQSTGFSIIWNENSSIVSSAIGEEYMFYGGTINKTTIEMQDENTYLNANWSSEVWNIDSDINDGFPYLDWENSGGTPLPVELTSFTANADNNKVLLNWETASEVNNYGFEIQKQEVRSKKLEGVEWEMVGFVEGSGNSNSPKEYSFIDQEYDQDKKIIRYRLKQIDFDGKFEYSGVVEVEVNTLPIQFALEQNYPNPFNPSTSIEYSVVSSEYVSLKVYDILGNEVATLVNEKIDAGNYRVNFNAASLSSGVYFYSINAGEFNQVRKMMLVK